MAPVDRLDRLIWSLVGLSAAIVLLAPLLGEFAVAWRSFAPPALACVLLLGAGWLYRYRRTDPRLAGALIGTAQIVAFAAVGAPLSYIAASANLPLQDHALALADRALGFDWRGLLAWMNGSPTAYAILRQTYQSLTLQMTTVVLCLAFTGALLRLRIYVLAFVLAALITIAVSAALPAAGAWPYYGLTATEAAPILPVVSTSWPVFDGLRDGSLRTLVAVGSEGIITFPSLHAALAVIVIIAAWPVPILRWVFLAVDAAMLVATPIDGSHYLVDVIAGIALAVLCMVAAGRIAEAAALRGRRTAMTPALRPATLVDD
jgi:PAP2 superfamily